MIFLTNRFLCHVFENESRLVVEKMINHDRMMNTGWSLVPEAPARWEENLKWASWSITARKAASDKCSPPPLPLLLKEPLTPLCWMAAWICSSDKYVSRGAQAFVRTYVCANQLVVYFRVKSSSIDLYDFATNPIFCVLIRILWSYKRSFVSQNTKCTVTRRLSSAEAAIAKNHSLCLQIALSLTSTRSSDEASKCIQGNVGGARLTSKRNKTLVQQLLRIEIIITGSGSLRRHRADFQHYR